MGLVFAALILCLIGTIAPAGAATTLSAGQTDVAQAAVRHVSPAAVRGTGAHTARPAGKGCSLGRPPARSPQGTTTPLRPTLSWSKVRGASYYDIQIFRGTTLKRFFDGHRGTSRHVLNALPANVHSPGECGPGDAGLTGAWSRRMKFIISPPGPVSPIATITSDTPMFQWSRLRGATTYDFSISGAGARLVKSGLTALPCTPGRALPANVPLKWKVRGRNADGKGVWSRDVAFTVVPDAPTLTITASDRSKTYGHALVLGDSAFTTAGLRPGDSVTSVTLASAGAPAAAAVSGSPYAIVPSAAGRHGARQVRDHVRGRQPDGGPASAHDQRRGRQRQVLRRHHDCHGRFRRRRPRAA